MEIRNFSQPIRIGDFPYSMDIRSSHNTPYRCALEALIPSFALPNRDDPHAEQPRIILCIGEHKNYILSIFRYKNQYEDFVSKNTNKVLFDSNDMEEQV